MSEQMRMLAMNNPALARMLDEQDRQKQYQQRVAPTNYGGGAMGSFLTAASGAQKSLGAGAESAVGKMMGKETPMGAREQVATQNQQTEQVVADAMRDNTGGSYSERLLKVAEQLEKTGNPQAVRKATELRQQAQVSSLQEAQLAVSKQNADTGAARVSVDKTEAENRAIQLQLTKEQQLAANALEEKRIEASTTEQKIVIDSQGNKFNMITSEGGNVNYVPLKGGVGTPEGSVQTINEVTVDKQLKARNDLEFSKFFIAEKKEVATAYKDTKKVFESANTAYDLLKEVTGAGAGTGGIVPSTERKIKRYLGIADDKSVPQELLKKELGMAIAANLKATFGGSQITDSERKFLEANMISIDDTPETIARKLEATMEVSKKGLAKMGDLLSSEGYTEFTSKQNKYIEQDYLDVQDKYNLQFGTTQPQEQEMTAIQKQAQEMLQQRRKPNPSVRDIRNR